MNLQVLMFHQDDPRKCTAAKMVRFGLARSIQRIGRRGLVLDPFSDQVLLPRDRFLVNAIIGIDCSWSLAEREFSRRFGRIRRRLPPLLAGNPVNYSKLGKLTTVEALSAALTIMGFQEQAADLLGKFKWGHTFLDLNRHLLEEYSGLEDQAQIEEILKEYRLVQT